MKNAKLALATVLLTSAFILPAADNTNKWEGSAAAGVTLTKGNSDTFLGNITLAAARKAPPDEWLFGASATYGTTETEEHFTTASGLVVDHDTKETTTANASGFGQYNHLFNDRWYWGARLDLLHDAVAEIKYRVTISPLVGYYAIKEPMTTLKFEAGPAGVFERVGSGSETEDNQYCALRLGERFEHKFSDKAKVWQSLDFLPQVDDFANYIIIGEIGAEAALNQSWALRAVFQDNYDHRPAEGRKQNDIKFITSVVYKF
jgi:putative salt-induced outer membrane protein YdiY